MKKIFIVFAILFTFTNSMYCKRPHAIIAQNPRWILTRMPFDPVPYLVDEDDAIGVCSNCHYCNVMVEIYSDNQLISYEVIPELLPNKEYLVSFQSLSYGNYNIRISVGEQYVLYDVTY